MHILDWKSSTNFPKYFQATNPAIRVPYALTQIHHTSVGGMIRAERYILFRYGPNEVVVNKTITGFVVPPVHMARAYVMDKDEPVLEIIWRY